jgi:hypothetical protein
MCKRMASKNPNLNLLTKSSHVHVTEFQDCLSMYAIIIQRATAGRPVSSIERILNEVNDIRRA